MGRVVHLTSVLSATCWPVSGDLMKMRSSALRIALELRQRLHDHVIAVHLAEVLGDLALAECVIERVVDQLRLDSEARRLVAVDRDGQRCAAGLLVGGDAGELGQRFQLVVDFRRPLVDLVEVGVLQRVLEQRPAEPSADIDVLRGLKEQGDALDLRELRLQPPDDLRRGWRNARRAA